jgi:diguanylate cyclase (GGDEF)-like protein
MVTTQDMLASLLDALPDGVSLLAPDAGHRVVYANAAYVRMTGVPLAALVGHGSPLFAAAVDALARSQLESAVTGTRAARVLFRDRRADGASFWHEVQLEPLGPGPLAGHWLALHREAGARTATRGDAAPAEVIQRGDVMTGLASRAWFEQVIARDAAAAAREARPLTLFAIHIDALERYAETFDRSGADACERRIARALGTAFRRASDCLARWDSGRFVALAAAMNPEQAGAHAETLRTRVRELHIHHPRLAVGRCVTISIGVACGAPPRDAGAQALQDAAFAALAAAQGEGGDRIEVRGL